MSIPKIQSAKANPDYTLDILFLNGKKKRYSLRRLFKNPHFDPLQSFSFLKNFSIEKGGYALVWNSEIDISEYELWKNGEEIYPEKTEL